MEIVDLIMWLLVGGYALSFFVYPHFVFALLPAVFPLYLWRTELLGVPSNFVEILILLSAFLWFLKFVVFKQKDLFDKQFFKEWWKLLALMIVASAISLFFVEKEVVSLIDGDFDRFRVALGIFKSWVLVPIIYFLLFGFLDQKKWYKKISFNAYLFSALILAIWALLQVFTGDFITIDERASGPFVSANYLSLYIGPAVLGSGILAWNKYKKNDLTLWYFWVFIVCFLALIFSRSYGAFLGIAAGALFYFIMATKSLKKFGIFALLVAVLGAGIIYTQKDTTKFKDFFEFDTRSSSSVRLQTWEIAGTLIKENPLKGIGLGQFEAEYELQGEEILDLAPHESTQLHAHNVFLSFWLNTGILGFAFLLLLIAKVFRKVLLERRKRLIFVGALFLLMLVHGLVDQPFWKNDLSLLWWFIIGLI